MPRLRGRDVIDGNMVEFNTDSITDEVIVKNIDGLRWHAIDPSTIRPADDPRKAMLKTLRQRLLLESRPVLNDAYEGMLYLSDVNAILDEMEAKL